MEAAGTSAAQGPESMDDDTVPDAPAMLKTDITEGAVPADQPVEHILQPMSQCADTPPVNKAVAETGHESSSGPKGAQSVREVTVAEAEEEQRRREPTPEELANLGKAVDMVQARSCQLSPSLLTVGQTPPDMDSPARDAFERGATSVMSCSLQSGVCRLHCHRVA